MPEAHPTDLQAVFAAVTQHTYFRRFCQQVAALETGQVAAISGAVSGSRILATAALHATLGRLSLLVVADREEANYATGDLANLLPDHTVALFPATARRPYQLEDLDNANILQRAETLNLVARHEPARLILVTYPEALFEKVINRRALVKNTLSIVKGHELGMAFVEDMLDEYGFDRVDMVTEPGEYAVRGGIIDLFSFATTRPARVEFDDDYVASIRYFDLESQLSVEVTDELQVVPNVQTRLLEEERVSLLGYLPTAATVYLYDVQAFTQEVDKFYDTAETRYLKLLEHAGGHAVRSTPDALFCNAKELLTEMRQFVTVHTGGALDTTGDVTTTLQLRSAPQPPFKKNFALLAYQIQQNHHDGLHTYLLAENQKQHHRLKELLRNEDPDLAYTLIQATLHNGFTDHALGVAVYTDHQLFERYHRYATKRPYEKSKTLTIQQLASLRPGDFVTHMQYGIGRFAGLERRVVDDQVQEMIKILFRDDAVIYETVNQLYKISKYSGHEGTAPALSKLGSAEWGRTKVRVKGRLKELAFDLVKLYAERKIKPGHAYSPDNYLMDALEASFPYEETPDQLKAVEDVKRDMQAPHPMDRLVCGDVGFGKTEVAVRAAFKAAADGKQVAVLVPTTVLALQHYNTFCERMEGLPVNIEFVNRYKSKKELTEVLKKLADGKIDILIGTHRLLSADVKFKDLGLLIIDEEHKFGVGAKEKLRVMRTHIDTLCLTATPIPRTLQFSLLGIRDLSTITTPPPNRQPVETVLSIFSREILRDAVAYELKRDGQVFFIHNKIKDLPEWAALIKDLVPDARIAIAHGQLTGEQMEEIMLKFINKEANVLISTTIIESGLDISNANTMIINEAHTYGLSDIHQMRGRVGRSSRKAFCYLFAPPLEVLPSDASKRLNAIVELSDLGSGIQIAMRDLGIRGAGDILGKEQSGFIMEMGYDAYIRILNEAIQELKAEHYADLDGIEQLIQTDSAADCLVELDAPAIIPDQYVPNVAERLNCYKRISEAPDENTLAELAREFADRFGMLPPGVLNLLDTVRIRRLAAELGLTRISHKGNQIKAYFPDDPKSPYYQGEAFGRILAYVQAHPRTTRLKQKGTQLSLIIDQLPTVKDLLYVLKDMNAMAVAAEA